MTFHPNSWQWVTLIMAVFVGKQLLFQILQRAIVLLWLLIPPCTVNLNDAMTPSYQRSSRSPSDVVPS